MFFSFYCSMDCGLKQTWLMMIPARTSYEKAVCPSVRPSVKRVDRDKTEESSVQIFILYERPFSLVLWEEELLILAFKFCYHLCWYCWYQQFELVISTIGHCWYQLGYSKCCYRNIDDWWYQHFELAISLIQNVDTNNLNC